MHVKEFFHRWKKGIHAVTPLQQLRAKRLAILGQAFGVLVGIFVMYYQGLYYWIILLFFTLVALIIDLLGIHQQVSRLEKMFGG